MYESRKRLTQTLFRQTDTFSSLNTNNMINFINTHRTNNCEVTRRILGGENREKLLLSESVEVQQ